MQNDHLQRFLVAVAAGRDSEAVDIVNSGLRVNDTLASGDTPLTMAATLGRGEVIVALLGAGARVNEETGSTRETALSMAATAHFFAWAGLDFPAAVNGPQYLVDRGTMDPSFRPRGDSLQVPTGPGLGIELTDEARSAMTNVAAAREALPA